MTTLETGAGQTTVVFAISGTKHTCITPDTQEIERIKQYCDKLQISYKINFIVGSSDIILPSDEMIPNELNHVFIDGAHAFPAPIIDWHYTACKLKIGGIVSIDDFRMPSVQILYNFLNVESEWELVKIVQNTAFFRKLREPKDLADWTGQKINSKYPGY